MSSGAFQVAIQDISIPVQQTSISQVKALFFFVKRVKSAFCVASYVFGKI